MLLSVLLPAHGIPSSTVSEFVQASPMVKIYQELADKVLEMSEDTKGDE